MKTDSPLTRQGQALCPYIPAFLLATVGAAITCFDAIFMAEGAAAMTPSYQGPLVAGVAICAAIFKAGWLSAFRTFLLRRHILLALAVLAFGLLTHVFSMASTIGIAATGRDTVISTRLGAQDRHARAVESYDAARARRAAMTATRPVAQVRADLVAIETEVAEQASREAVERATVCGSRCTEAISKGERAKAARTALQGELATALEAAKADADMRAAAAALESIAAPGVKDPQSAALAAYVPLASFTEREAALMMPLLPSLIVEIGGPICFLIAGAWLGLARENVPPCAVVQLAERVESIAQTIPAQKRLPAPLAPAMSAGEITAVREAVGESQGAFAERLGVSSRTLRRWETGERSVSRKAVLKARTIAAEFRG